ncbi:uncharacterized protein JCM6883_001733 [Sporobolomyces salmoneus]|uniref:uncharacterized protein n=1 Tax=Sporobolomyces salmoneus TaxID=183962 RepID=UPI00316B9CA2
MPSSDYKHKPGGGLKLKGGGADPSKKKKRKSSSSKKAREGGEEEESREVTKTTKDDEERGDRSESPVVASGSSSSGPVKTKAQLRFEQVQRERLLERAKKFAVKSHKDRVAEFNEQLEALPTHYDIPKVGPG